MKTFVSIFLVLLLQNQLGFAQCPATANLAGNTCATGTTLSASGSYNDVRKITTNTTIGGTVTIQNGGSLSICGSTSSFGALTLSNSTNTIIINAGATLTIGTTGTPTGSMTWDGTATIMNYGTLIINDMININNGNITFINAGTIQSNDNGGINIQTTSIFINRGTAQFKSVTTSRPNVIKIENGSSTTFNGYTHSDPNSSNSLPIIFCGTGSATTTFTGTVNVTNATNVFLINRNGQTVYACASTATYLPAGASSANLGSGVKGPVTAAGTISGTATVCQGQAGVIYSVAAITNASGYTWSLPTGASITSGSNTNSITVAFSGTAVSGNITVAGTNACGTGAASPSYAVTVNALPSAAGTISGSAGVCKGQMGVVYSVAAIAGATSYSWTLPTGASITSGSGTNTITVSFSTTASSGNITVAGVNSCGSGTSSSFSVTVSNCDIDGDGIPNTTDVDVDNDGIPDYLEVTSCSGSVALNYDSYADGTNPTTISLTNAPVTLTVSQSFSAGTTILANYVQDYFTGTTEKEIMINQQPASYADKSTTTFNFSTAVFGLTFKIQDIDYSPGTWIDSLKVTLFYKGVSTTLNASQLTLGLDVNYAGNNIFIGKTGNSANNSLDGQAIINYPYMVDKIVIDYWNNDASHGAQRVGYGGFTFCHISSADSDGDGIPNYMDLDSDNDGIPDVIESYGVDVNGDGIIDNFVDANADGLSDNAAFTSAANGLGIPDFDGDGIPNYLDLDSDNDGIPDIIEAGGTDGNNDGRIDSFTDSNANGYQDALEGASALIKSGADTNNDGLADSWPNKNADLLGYPNLFDLDSDGDGILDVVESGLIGRSGTNGTVSASNGIVSGTRTNGWANTVRGLASLSLTNSDGDTKPNYLDIDSDNDGITDNVEGQSTTSYKVPTDVDTDGDGINDVYELPAQIGTYGGGGITPFDKDSDTTPDYIDTDTDNDGVPDRNEGDRNNPFVTVTQSTIDNSGDTDGDGLMNIFDNVTITSLTAGNYYKNVTMGNMGAGVGFTDNFDGPVPSGSLIGLQKSDPSNTIDRDWRNASILPLQIVNVFVNYTVPNATIKWNVVNEKDIATYEAEFSADGVSFTTIQQITAKNNGNADYTVLHNLNAYSGTVVYYRVKQINRNGQFFYTNLIPLRLSAKSDVIIHANPFSSSIGVTYKSQQKEMLNVQLYSVDGRLMTSKVVNLNAGSNYFSIDNLMHLQNGTYILSFKSNISLKTIQVQKK